MLRLMFLVLMYLRLCLIIRANFMRTVRVDLIVVVLMNELNKDRSRILKK